MQLPGLWPSIRTALATLNVNGWMRRSRESRRTPPRRESVLSMVNRHKLDLVAL